MPGSSDANSSLLIILDRTARALEKRLQNIFLRAGHDITVEQWMVMLLLWQQNGQFQQQIADAIAKDKATVTRLLNGLEKRNLIVRVPDKADRRQKQIFLTNLGKQLEEDLIMLSIENAKFAQEHIPAEDIQKCSDVLYQVYERLTQE
jgi:DNA-binding MarR family transcriptional regulator